MYTPGLKISESTLIKRTRELPIKGSTLVKVGASVKAKDQVLEAHLPGDVEILRLARLMGLEPIELSQQVKFNKGQKVEKGELIAKVRTFFGLFSTEFRSPTTGEVEFFNQANCHLGIRLAPKPIGVNAYINGRVSGLESNKSVTIETNAAFAQGIFGVGGEAQGKVLALPLTRETLIKQEVLKAYHDKLLGSIIVGGSSFSFDAIMYAAEQGAKAIITASIEASTLKQYVGYEIGVSITGDEDLPLTLIISEGFGQLAMNKRLLSLAEQFNGEDASVNGATQVRAGAMRPELIIPSNTSVAEAQPEQALEVGRQIRIIRVPYFGELAEITELPSKPEQIQSGAKVRVLRAKILSSQQEVSVPRANVELV